MRYPLFLTLLCTFLLAACGETSTGPGGGTAQDVAGSDGVVLDVGADVATDSVATDSTAADDTAKADDSAAQADTPAPADVPTDAGKTVTASAALCAPCTNNLTCASEGAADAACVSWGAAGAFCGMLCSANGDCPGDYECADGKDIDGKDVKQCKPTSGTCTCSKWAVDNKAKSDCTDASGKCKGEVICEAEGAAKACSASEPSKEECNSLDDDCNGKTDEGDAICDDDNVCTSDACIPGKGCTNGANFEFCDDGDKCTDSDACDGGKCAGTAIKCDDGKVCTDDACDPKTGCTTTNNSAECDDSSKCTKDDKCAEGDCKGAAIACDDGNLCTEDGCDPAQGCTVTNNNKTCDDNDSCTKGDACTGGQCAGKALDCDDKNACTKDFCTQGKGCEHSAITGACDDGDPCTDTSVCIKEKCVGATITCDDGEQCTFDSCDPKTGKCVFTNKVKDAKCDDGDVCTSGDACVAGKCTGKKSDCDDKKPCTTDTCDPKKGCTNVELKCDDFDSCTTDACDAKAGKCAYTEVAGCGSKAFDLPYAVNFKCGAKNTLLWKFEGDKSPGWAVDATPKVPGFKSADCSLNYNNGKDYVCPTGAKSTSGNAISPAVNIGNALKPMLALFLAGAWEGGGYDNLEVAVQIDGTTEWKKIASLLKPATGTWKLTPISLKDYVGKTIRVRLRFWTKDCILNSTSGPFIDDLAVLDIACKNDAFCDDDNVCTKNTCDVKTGDCKSTPVPKVACDDGKICTIKDTCDDKGKCIGGGGKCDDGNGCTDDSCDSKTGACTKKNNTKACDDGDKCSDGDVCDGAGTCKAAAGAKCDDGNACTTDSCDKGTGLCKHAKVDNCAPKCKADADCHDGDPCTADKCDVAKGTCSNAPGNAGQVCGIAATCDAGQCKPATAGWAVRISGHPQGYFHCALLADKTVACWGRNDQGQLGNGKTNFSGEKAPVAVVDLKAVTDVAVGYRHACALLDTKKVVCWGDGGSGQLGDGLSKDSSKPVAVKGLAGVKAITMGGYFGCALLDGGTVRCWGANYDGQLGTGDKLLAKEPVAVKGLSAVTALTAGMYGTCALRVDGSVWCWGANVYRNVAASKVSDDVLQPTKRAGLGLMSNFDLGDGHGCGVGKDGQLRCVGRNNYGQSGTGKASTATSSEVRMVKGAAGAVVYSGGYYHGAANLADGLAMAWGGNLDGQLGDGTKTHRFAPVLMKYVKDIIQVEGSRNRTCVLRKDGSVWCTGDAVYYALGNGSTLDKTTLVKVNGGGCKADADCANGNKCLVAKCDSGACKITNAATGESCDDGDLCSVEDKCASGGVCTAKPKDCADNDACTVNPVCNAGKCSQADKVNCDDGDACTKDACDTKTGACSHTAIGGCTKKCTKAADCDDGSICTKDACEAGACKHSPAAEAAICAVGSTCSSGTCKPVTKGWAKSLAVNSYGYFACAITHDKKVVCWGRNDQGQIGVGTTTNAKTPMEVKGLTDVVQLAAGYRHVCALLAGGGVKCWGDNADGQLGTGNKTDAKLPVDVKGLGAIQSLSAGNYHTCAVGLDSTVKCWGRNSDGQLGNGVASFTDVTAPTPVKNLVNVVEVQAGAYHNCTRTKSGAVWCWGRNLYYETAEGSTADQPTPVEYKGLAGATGLDVGYDHTCVTAADGVRCVGSNTYGQIGTGDKVAAKTPVNIKGLVGTVQVNLGRRHTLALATNGSGKSWGYNDYGQLADGTKTQRLSPGAMTKPGNLTQLGGAYYFTCALNSEGQIWCVGRGSYGELGDGSGKESQSWKRVAMPCKVNADCDGGATCFAAACDAGTCKWTVKPDASCNDGDGCTLQDKCDAAGVCIGKAKDCEDGNVCTVGTTCDDGKCGSVSTKSCNDFDPCTIDTCDAKTGKCSHAPDAGCTFKCKTAADCTDGNLCTVDTCDAGTGKCKHANTPDGAICGEAMTCGGGACKAAGKGWATKIAAHPYGYAFCAVRGDATAACWGRNTWYQGGNGSSAVATKPKPVTGLKDVAGITLGYQHACAYDKQGTLWCWGANGDGQLGKESSTTEKTPKQVAGAPKVVDLGLGYAHTCAVAADTTVWCWGRNTDGQLGQGKASSTDIKKPTQVPGLANVVSVAAGYSHTCALDSGGDVWCWGSSHYYHSGSGTADVVKPTKYAGLSGSIAISLGYHLTCALNQAGQVRCVGYNYYGQAGVGNKTSPVKTPTLVPALGPVGQVAAGYYASYALAATGTAWAVGRNNYGQLGVDNKTDSVKPLAMLSGGSAIQVATSRGTGCVLKADGSVWCVGYNSYGELGNGKSGFSTQTTKLAPVTGTTPP